MKEYYLLRNNRESGPYSLEQIQQSELQKHDLIWIENLSFTWKYPCEIQELKSMAPSADYYYGSLINSRKEKQIRYFKSNYRELLYKKLCIESISIPDAYLSDIETGFEYLVNPQLIPAEFEATPMSETEFELSYDNVLDENAYDTPEILANPEFFNSPATFTRLYGKKAAKSWKFGKFSIFERMILGICLVLLLAIACLLAFGSHNETSAESKPVQMALHQINPQLVDKKDPNSRRMAYIDYRLILKQNNWENYERTVC